MESITTEMEEITHLSDDTIAGTDSIGIEIIERKKLETKLVIEPVKIEPTEPLEHCLRCHEEFKKSENKKCQLPHPIEDLILRVGSINHP